MGVAATQRQDVRRGKARQSSSPIYGALIPFSFVFPAQALKISLNFLRFHSPNHILLIALRRHSACRFFNEAFRKMRQEIEFFPR